MRLSFRKYLAIKMNGALTRLVGRQERHPVVRSYDRSEFV